MVPKYLYGTLAFRVLIRAVHLEKLKVGPMSSRMGSVFSAKYHRSVIHSYALSKGAPVLYDFFNIFKIALGVNSPATPVTLNLCQQTFTLPSNECGAGDIKAAADRACFIFFRTFAFHHGAFSGYSAYT
jgi:hypothetical protein